MSQFSRLALLTGFAAAISGCTLVSGTSKSQNALSAAQSPSLGTSTTSSSITSVPSQSTSVPTADAIVGRIQKGIPTANPNAGNFKTVLAQVQQNLPSTSDPTKATGLEQIPILVFAACSDINPSTYSVNVNTSLSANMTNLVSAGVTMVNQHVGNLAASGQLNQQVAAVFTTLINSNLAAGASTAMTFVSICTAANSFGVGMVGF